MATAKKTIRKKSATAKKTGASKKKTTAKKKVDHSRCRPSHRVSHAGHLLVISHDPESGHILATTAKHEKSKRRSKGCLNGVKPQGKSFKLTAKQKKNLPLNLQKAIIAYHKGK